MDQKMIMEGLTRALAQGTGDLNDLENLLKRAQADIEVARQEEAKAKAEAEERAKKDKVKRANDVAAMANRVIEGHPSADDVALVLQAYLNDNGINIQVTAESVADSIKDAHEVSAQFDQLMKQMNNLLFNTKPKSEPVKMSPEDAIDKFLRDMGIRQ